MGRKDGVTILPALVVVSGPPGSGKTTLAHRLAAAVGCPAICRDEIKEGMVHTTPGFVPGPGDELSLRTNAVFFAILETLLRAGVTIVAEAAFQDHRWRPGLEPLLPLARIRIVHCTVDPELALRRSLRRSGENQRGRAHPDPGPADAAEYLARLRSFESVALAAAPSVEVDTTDGYQPALGDLVEFLAP